MQTTETRKRDIFTLTHNTHILSWPGDIRDFCVFGGFIALKLTKCTR